jgi:hypothetical protein
MKRSALLLLVLGLVLFALGFALDPLWPAQDAPPELVRREAAAASRAAWTYRAGALALLGSACCLVAATLARRWRRPP